MLELFPFQTMRSSQRKVLNEIDQALKSGYKQIVLEASTGFGKSPVAITVARSLGSSYICTSTINLQDQYLRDFQLLKKIIGKNNFECQVLRERYERGEFECVRCSTKDISKCIHTTVDQAPCKNRKRFKCSYATTRLDYSDDLRPLQVLRLLSKDPKTTIRGHYNYETFYKDKVAYEDMRYDEFKSWPHYTSYGYNWSACNYYDQKNIGLLSSHTILNYAIFNKLSQIKLKIGKPYLEPREVLILDEGHLFGNEVIAQNGEDLELKTIMNLTHDKIVKLSSHYTVDECIKFLKLVVEYIEKNIIELNEEEKLLALKHKDEKERRRLESLPNIIEYIEEKRDKIKQLVLNMEENPDNWVIDRNAARLIIKPLDITEYCKELYKNASNLLIMSATILDKELYCSEIGLDPTEVKFISIDSDFPVENRPIFTPYLGKLSKDNINLSSTHKVIANNLNKILSEYSNVKGLIHMPTNSLIDQIIPLIKDRKRLYIVKSMTSRERAQALRDFEADPNGVLMSPSLYVGIDLKDDLSRFQVIVKIPYPSLGDKWIKKKFDQNKKWYSWQTALKVIQGYGRSVRHDEDYCDTYILDSNFENILRFSSSMIPKSFKDAINYGRKYPDAKIGNKVRIKQK